jgi:type IV pilus assembly protein PilA
VNRILWAAALAAMPVAAHANAGIGFFMIAVPFIVVALLPAVLLEAGVLWRLLPVTPRRALGLSLSANLRSSIWGVFLAIGVDLAFFGLSGSAGPEPTKAMGIAALVPLFFLTWRIEHRAVLRLEPDLSRARVALATGAANLLTYALMIAVIVLTPVLPEYPTMPVRARVGEVLVLAGGARSAVNDYYESKGRLPQNGGEAGFSESAANWGPYVSAIEIRERGVVVITLAKHDNWPAGSEIRLTPAPDADAKKLSWKCRSTLPPKVLPSFCRE